MTHTGQVTTNTQPVDTTAVCCPSGITAPPSGQASQLAAALKALADPTRLRLVQLIAAHPDATACICDLTDPVGVSQPTVSHHMKLLMDAGLVTRQQRGKWAYYTLTPQAFTRLGHDVTKLAS